VRREVEATHKGHGVVDHGDLLVVARPDRVFGVESEADAPVRARRKAIGAERFALGEVEKREIPLEHVDVQLSIPPDECVEQRRQLVGHIVVGVVATQSYPAVEVPAQQEHTLFGSLEGSREGPEVLLSIHQDGGTRSALDPPAGAAGGQERCGCVRILGARFGRGRLVRHHRGARPSSSLRVGVASRSGPAAVLRRNAGTRFGGGPSARSMTRFRAA